MNQLPACQMKYSSIISITFALASIIIGIFLSRIPKKLGFYRWVTTLDPSAIGLTPAHHYGIPWGYTLEEYYDNCSAIKGQNALVTGGNSGIGFAIANALATCGVHVTIACRNAERCTAAVKKMKENAATIVSITTMVVDTSSLSSVREFSKDFLVKNDGRSLDMLFLNAGRGQPYGEMGPLILSEDGIEITFATNYLGHHLMWKYLEPLVLKSITGRVVLTSSSASFKTFPNKVATSMEELHGQGSPPTDLRYYSQSKLAQILWTKKVSRELANDTNMYVNAAHPGFCYTPLLYSTFKPSPFIVTLVDDFVKDMTWTSEEGALTLLYLGVETTKLKEGEIRGKYFHPQTQEVVNPLSLDEKLQDKLWKFSNDLVANFV